MIENMIVNNIQRDYQRLIFGSYQTFLAGKGHDSKLRISDRGTWDLLVTVPGPSDNMARFTLSVDESLPGKPVSISAYYKSVFLDSIVVDSWTVAQSDSAEDVCNDIIIEFVSRCSYEEFSSIVEGEIINDVNLNDFINLLSDDTLTEENIYAVGFRIEDDGGMEIAAAASFFFTPDKLVVDSIMISDIYDIPGFADYIARYIYNTAVVE